MRQLQLSLAAGTSLHARHFKRLSDDAMLRVSAPALARLRAVGAMGDTGTLAGALSIDGACRCMAASTAMRRIARERGPITRRIAAQGLVRSATSELDDRAQQRNVAFSVHHAGVAGHGDVRCRA